MVIGFDGSRAFSKDKTGTENYSYQLLLNLSKIDQSNQYIVYLRPGTKIQNFPNNFQFKTINFHRLWTQVGLAYQTFKDKLDILFVPAHTLPLIRKPGLKTIMTVHDLGAEYLPAMHQLKQTLYLDFITRFQLKTATKLIAVSKATKADLVKKLGIDSSKVEVIYEGVDREVFQPIKNDQLINILNKFDIEKGKYFLFVGTIQPRKNLVRLVEAFRNLIRGPVALYPRPMSSLNAAGTRRGTPARATPHQFDLRLVLVGQKGWLSDEIYQLPKKLGIEKNVKFLGRVSDKNLAALYSGAIALTYPSLFEGFGLPILEAMSCGCPVITSNLSSMPEVTADAALLVNPYKVSEIAKAMGKLSLNEPVLSEPVLSEVEVVEVAEPAPFAGPVEGLILNDTLRDNMIEKGYKQVEKFSWKKAARETLKVFERVKSQRSKVKIAGQN